MRMLALVQGALLVVLLVGLAGQAAFFLRGAGGTADTAQAPNAMTAPLSHVARRRIRLPERQGLAAHMSGAAGTGAPRAVAKPESRSGKGKAGGSKAGEDWSAFKPKQGGVVLPMPPSGGGSGAGAAAKARGGKAAPAKQRPAASPSGTPTPSPKPKRKRSGHGHHHKTANAAQPHTGVDYFCKNRASVAEVAGFGDAYKSSMTDYIGAGGRFPIVILTYNRAAMLERTISSLLSDVRCVTKDDLFISQDGADPDVTAVIEKAGIKSIQSPAGNGLGRSQDGARLIAAHYHFSLSQGLTAFPHAPGVIVVEDDFLFSPDWYEYFHATAPVLDIDPSVWLISAWNDNGFDYLVADPYALRRTRYFPGLGWLLPRKLWETEIGRAWPEQHWDHWMRDPARHRGRDVVFPEIPRNYHAGVKGTFMDTQTHNRYFGSIAMQADPGFTWDTPQGAHAIARVTQPRYDERLERLLSDPETVHLGSVSDILQHSTGTGVVWYDCPINQQNHESMRVVAGFFGLWHEGARGSREGVHELWWLGDSRLILVNACKTGAGALIPVTGSIECARGVQHLMPGGWEPIPWTAFREAAERRPQLPLHTGLFGALIRSPLSHLNGGSDANGPVDVAPDKGKDELIAAAKDAPRSGKLLGRPGLDAGAADAAELAEESEEEDDSEDGGGEGGGGHSGFLSDLDVTALRGGAAAVPAGAGPGAGPATLAAGVMVVKATAVGESCTQVCEAMDAKCVRAMLPAINDCATLRANYDCDSCQDSVGADQPAFISTKAPRDKKPGTCLVNTDASLFSCDGSWQFAMRVCPCKKA